MRKIKKMKKSSGDSDVYVYGKVKKREKDFNIAHFTNELDTDDSDVLLECKENKKNQKVTRQCKEHISSGPILPGGHRFERKYICIQYPGNVINPDKAIETLGGLGHISTAIDTPNRRLELRFRSDDGYCKPACGDRHATTAFLLRIKVNKLKAVQAQTESTVRLKRTREFTLYNQTDSTEITGDATSKKLENFISASPTFDLYKYVDLSQDENYELPKLRILGRIDTEFKFTSLCDFQYLPMTQCMKNCEPLECIYDSIYPLKLPPYSWLKNEVPYFLPPAAFSRMGNVQQYAPKTEVDTLPENIIGKSRKRRAGFSNFIYFTTVDVPTSQPKGIDMAMKVKFLQQAHLEQMRKIFESRPIWSKNALMCKTKFTSDQLKILLPCVAYYFMTGPWRVMWVKLGYDPRKDISARKYQTLDYRLKAMHGLGSSVKCKRNYAQYTLPYRSTPASKPKPTVLTTTTNEEQMQRKEHRFNENVFIYREGTLPPSRQMFYQYCDILIDEIQEMLAKLPDPHPGIKCHEKRGWLPSGFDDQCREIINRQVRALLRKQMNIPDDHPTKLPKKRKNCAPLKLNKLKFKENEQRNVEEISVKQGTLSDNQGENKIIIDTPKL